MASIDTVAGHLTLAASVLLCYQVSEVGQQRGREERFRYTGVLG